MHQSQGLSWRAEARLSWPEECCGVRVEHWEFFVVCPVPLKPRGPQDRTLATLELVCAETDRYATPPKTVSVRTLDERGGIVGLAETRWRAGLGFTHGLGIQGVAAPPPDVSLSGLARESSH